MALWVQASPVCTDILQSYIGPFLTNIIDNLIPLAKIAGSDGNKSGGGLMVIVQPFLYTLKAMGLLGDQSEGLIKSLLQDSVSFVLCIFFCLTPWKVASIGVIIIGFVIPAYNTSLVISSKSSYTQMQAIKLENTPVGKITLKIGDGSSTISKSEQKVGGSQNCNVCRILGRLCSKHNPDINLS